MPHLDFSTYFGQIFWLLISFAVLYALVSALILPKIASVVETRAKHIADDLDQAESLKNQAEDAEKKYQKSLAESAEKARKLIGEAYDKAKQKSDTRRQELGVKLDNKTREAEEEIAAIASESGKVAGQVSSELSGVIVNKILKAA